MLQRPLGSRHDDGDDDDVSGDADEQPISTQHRPLMGKDQLHWRGYQDLSASALRAASDQELRHFCRKAPLVPATTASLTAIMALADGLLTIGHWHWGRHVQLDLGAA